MGTLLIRRLYKQQGRSWGVRVSVLSGPPYIQGHGKRAVVCERVGRQRGACPWQKPTEWIVWEGQGTFRDQGGSHNITTWACAP